MRFNVFGIILILKIKLAENICQLKGLNFYDQIQPTVADYFVFEAYSLVYDISPKLLSNDCQALVKLQQIMKERPALENYFKNNR